MLEYDMSRLQTLLSIPTCAATPRPWHGRGQPQGHPRQGLLAISPTTQCTGARRLVHPFLAVAKSTNVRLRVHLWYSWRQIGCEKPFHFNHNVTWETLCPPSYPHLTPSLPCAVTPYSLAVDTAKRRPATPCAERNATDTPTSGRASHGIPCFHLSSSYHGDRETFRGYKEAPSCHPVPVDGRDAARF